MDSFLLNYSNMPNIPTDLTNFILVALFSFLIGLEQRTHHANENTEFSFGTDRTFTLIGILGFILYIIEPKSLLPFLIGFIALVILLGIYYFKRISNQKDFGLTSIFTALTTYSLSPLVYNEPIWLVLLVAVTILVIVEIKEDLIKFSQKFDRNEFITLAKFIIIAGIILPLMSDKPISKAFNISPYKFWLTIVAVSSISYLSYLLKKFIFPKAGTFLTAILGGLYSSTATTLILARESKKNADPNQTAGGIIAATAMMYLRLLILAFIFNLQVARKLTIYFAILILVSIPFILYYFLSKNKSEKNYINIEAKKNPLEFKTALIFGLLFAFFAVLTHYIVSNYGKIGVNILSLIVGVTDIDPYILSLFQGENATLTISTIVHATVIAAAANDLIKMIYAISLGNKKIHKKIIIAFSAIIIASIILLIFIK